MTAASDTIQPSDFGRVDVRVGTIVRAEPFPAARKPAYKLQIDLGPELGVRRSTAQITARYALSDLPGRQVAVVVNLPPKQVANTISEVLVLGFPDAAGEVILVGPERPVPNGGRLY